MKVGDPDVNLGCFIGINKGIMISLWLWELHNKKNILSNGSSPQKNCNGVGLGEEAFFHLAQPNKQKTRQQIGLIFHMASFCICDVSLEIQIYEMHFALKKQFKTGLLLSAKRFLSPTA